MPIPIQITYNLYLRYLIIICMYVFHSFTVFYVCFIDYMMQLLGLSSVP